MMMANDLSENHANVHEFCERHAKAAATDLVTAFCSLRYRSCDGANSYAEFAKKFADRFIVHFENEYLKRNPAQIDTEDSQNTINNNEESCESEGDRGDSPSTRAVKQYSLLRRLSFNLRKGKKFFRKQDSDENEILEKKNNEKPTTTSKATKLPKISVECRKTGIVSYHVVENMDGPPKWDKCKLSLSTSAAGGYILNFYCPPKSTKPKCGVFCHLICEVRETTDLEMPDKENTFVVRAAFNAEYIIEAPSLEERGDWVATLKYCMRESKAIVEGDRASIGTVPDESLPRSLPSSYKGPSELDIPELPPRPPGGKLDTSSGLFPDQPRVDFDSDDQDSMTAELREYPWFHGPLQRNEAANLVQKPGEHGHGMFLVRNSETRKGEYVLTFNCQGKAKHLRLALNDLKQCHVQHLTFPSIFDALSNFRHNTIPLENGGFGDVKLTEYILNPLVIQSQQFAVTSSSNTHSLRNSTVVAASSSTFVNFPGDSANGLVDYRYPMFRASPSPPPREVITFNGHIRVKTRYLERRKVFPDSTNETTIPATSSTTNTATNASTSSTSGTNSRPVAVANTYSFI